MFMELFAGDWVGHGINLALMPGFLEMLGSTGTIWGYVRSAISIKLNQSGTVGSWPWQ